MRARWYAADRPDGPAPTTSTFLPLLVAVRAEVDRMRIGGVLLPQHHQARDHQQCRRGQPHELAIPGVARAARPGELVEHLLGRLERGVERERLLVGGEIDDALGEALLGLESTTPYPYPAPVKTALVLGAGRITYYFRTHFTLAEDPAPLLLTASVFVDDGAVFYLNGAEAARVRMAAGPVSYSTWAHLASPEGVYEPLPRKP